MLSGKKRGARDEGHVTLGSVVEVHVDVLKVDVEGAEFDAFSNACAHGSAHIGQLLLEVHSHTPYAPLYALIDRLETACGLLLFSKEANIWACVRRPAEP